MIRKAVILGACAAMSHMAVAKTDYISVSGGKVSYKIDQLGNRLIDYSYCGYRNSSQPIPDVTNVVKVDFRKGDNSQRLQRAIDYVASLKPDKNGFRGAVLLGEGDFELHAPLRVTASGVVLRGADKNKTRLVKKGFDRGSVVYIESQERRVVTDTLRLATNYLPLNSMMVELESASAVKPGSQLMIVRTSTKEWIASLGCDEYGGGISALGWKPGDIDIRWTRNVVSVDGNKVELDAPLSMQLDKSNSEAYALLFSSDGVLSESGVENLTLVSDYDRNRANDENHSWTGVSIDKATDCWVRNVSFENFAGSAVLILPGSSRVTVEDCISRNPVSEAGGWRRQIFKTYGELTLFQRCHSEYGINDFSAGYCAPGPNAFVQCEGRESMGFSGSVSAWACGLLFDVVDIDGHNLTFRNLGQDKNGAGWNSANSIFWQCTASEIECYSPSPDMRNLAIGTWAQFSGNGEWDHSNSHLNPRSLFYYQLKERGVECADSLGRILNVNTSASSSPTIEVAAQLARQAFIPKLTLEQWIEGRKLDLASNSSSLKDIDEIKIRKSDSGNMASGEFGITDGRITYDGKLLAGSKLNVQWWNGKTRDNHLEKAKPHITRFVPGREGLGLTDRIDSVVAYMDRENVVAMDHNYGLWYERRRDDHERIRRRDGDVWAPFYEQPFDRSGQSAAWDGLSKYDLAKPNAWYWGRLKEFADKSAAYGKLLFHQHYFQHNILEAGAHWVDFPWRSANNINQTGFPEPVPFAGDKRIFMADMFYDIDDPVRRQLHRNYIRQCLDNFADNGNVVQFVSAEYTGPLHFVRFWLDEIKAWKQETGKKVLVALSTTKDVQDSILTDKERASVVDIIDIRYWNYKTDGTIFAPEGGRNLAPRQHMRKMKIGKVGFAEAYAMVDEYRSAYPDKAVIYYGNNYPDVSWAIMMAEGSCPQLNISNEKLLRDIPGMDKIASEDGQLYKIGKIGMGYVIYSSINQPFSPDIAPGRYNVYGVDKLSGDVVKICHRTAIQSEFQMNTGVDKYSIFWFETVK